MQKDKDEIIQGCLRGNQADQMRLYQLYFSYGMSVCLRYSKNREEAVEILNDGFLRVFKKLHLFDANKDFKPWLRTILIHSAIAYFKKYNSKQDEARTYQDTIEYQSTYNLGLDTLAYEEVLVAVQQLPPAYRMVLNLYVMEYKSHEEIAEQLGVSIGTSKSNLHKARKKLQSILENDHSFYLNHEDDGEF